VRPLRGWRDNHHCEGRCPSRSPGYFYQNHIDLAGRHRARARRANCPCESGHADAAIAGRRSIRRASARRDDSAVAGRRHTGSQAAPRVRICVVIRVRNRASRWRGSIAVDRLIRSADNQHMRSQRVRFYEQKWIRFRERRGEDCGTRGLHEKTVAPGIHFSSSAGPLWREPHVQRHASSTCIKSPPPGVKIPLGA